MAANLGRGRENDRDTVPAHGWWPQKLVDSSSVARLQAERRGSRVDDFVESNESSAKRLDAASGEEPKQQALPVPAPSLPFIPPCSLGRYHALPGRVLGGPKQGPRRRAQGFVFPGSQSRPQRSQPATACEVCLCLCLGGGVWCVLGWKFAEWGPLNIPNSSWDGRARASDESSPPPGFPREASNTSGLELARPPNTAQLGSSSSASCGTRSL